VKRVAVLAAAGGLLAIGVASACGSSSSGASGTSDASAGPHHDHAHADAGVALLDAADAPFDAPIDAPIDAADAPPSFACDFVGPDFDAGADADQLLPPAWPDAALPNLVPVIASPVIEKRTFGPGSCEVAQGCTTAGTRRLLRFDIHTENAGPGDLVIGSPTSPDRPAQWFDWDPCAGYWRLKGFADYFLVRPDCSVAASGLKRAFCIGDDAEYIPDAGKNPPFYSCEYQGLHVGWYDGYEQGCDCQYVDITGVAPGDYVLEAKLNTLHVVAESSYMDDSATLRVTIPPDTDGGVVDGGPVDPTAACRMGEFGSSRDCGWESEGTRSCSPGDLVEVGCADGLNPIDGGASDAGDAAACLPWVGHSAEDPVLRVCEGSEPCLHGRPGWLGDSDDTCGDYGPIVTFPCPPGGAYDVLTGAHQSGATYVCTTGVLPRVDP
jgi:hypothetical protein